MNPPTTMQLYEFDAIVVATSADGTFKVPEGTVELTILGTPRSLFVINGLDYSDGLSLSRQFRTIGSTVIVNEEKLVVLKKGAAVRVTYSSLEDLNGIEIVNESLEIIVATSTSVGGLPNAIAARLEYLVQITRDAIDRSTISTTSATNDHEIIAPLIKSNGLVPTVLRVIEGLGVSPQPIVTVIN